MTHRSYLVMKALHKLELFANNDEHQRHFWTTSIARNTKLKVNKLFVNARAFSTAAP